MTLPLPQPETAQEAHDQAVDWQHWMSSQNLSSDEMAACHEHFTATGEKFGLTEEFKENWII